MRSEISQGQKKTNIILFHPHEVSKAEKFIGRESRMVVARAEGRGEQK